MTHLEIITEALTKCGIDYVVRYNSHPLCEGEWDYLFLIRESERRRFELEDLNTLLHQERFFEFRDGSIAS